MKKIFLVLAIVCAFSASAWSFVAFDGENSSGTSKGSKGRNETRQVSTYETMSDTKKDKGEMLEALKKANETGREGSWNHKSSGSKSGS